MPSSLQNSQSKSLSVLCKSYRNILTWIVILLEKAFRSHRLPRVHILLRTPSQAPSHIFFASPSYNWAFRARLFQELQMQILETASSWKQHFQTLHSGCCQGKCHSASTQYQEEASINHTKNPIHTYWKSSISCLLAFAQMNSFHYPVGASKLLAICIGHARHQVREAQWLLLLLLNSKAPPRTHLNTAPKSEGSLSHQIAF